MELAIVGYLTIFLRDPFLQIISDCSQSLGHSKQLSLFLCGASKTSPHA